jgi:hypothetical protein
VAEELRMCMTKETIRSMWEAGVLRSNSIRKMKRGCIFSQSTGMEKREVHVDISTPLCLIFFHKFCEMSFGVREKETSLRYKKSIGFCESFRFAYNLVRV